MGNFSLYLLTNGNFGKTSYFITEDFKKQAGYFFTENHKTLYFLTEDFKKKAAYFFTENHKASYIITEDFKKKAAYFLTTAFVSKYFLTEELEIGDFDNICHYPKQLDVIRQKAVLLIWKEVKNKLKNTLSAESWGKIETRGYFASGSLRLLLDYLSSIWLERDNDSKSGLVRTSDFYYKKYSINEVVVNFRECDINIKPIVALFDLNSYSVQDDGWPNYFVINNIINPPTEEGMATLKQHTDIFTLESINLDLNQSKYTIANAQTNFPLTKTLKYLSSFSINGSDYIGYVDYNYTTVIYSPSVLNGYTITSNDTVTITYWYEE
jgi:hypothetical protein